MPEKAVLLGLVLIFTALKFADLLKASLAKRTDNSTADTSRLLSYMKIHSLAAGKVTVKRLKNLFFRKLHPSWGKKRLWGCNFFLFRGDF